MTTVALVCSEPLKPSMTGVAIRYTEMARALAKEDVNVHLFAPQIATDFVEPEQVAMNCMEKGTLVQQLSNMDVVVVQGHLAEAVLDAVETISVARASTQKHSEIATVVDLYDPFLIENMSYAEILGEDVFQNDLQNWQRVCQQGDFFLCATQEQRLFYLGFLMAQKRVQPSLVQSDPKLKSLLGIVPFGVAETINDYQAYLPLASENQQRILFGGLYDWYDPLPLLAALDSPELEHCQLIFVRNPNRETTPQQLMKSVQQWCEEKHWGEERVSFIDWVPYDRSHDLLRDVDAMVATHPQSLETQLSFRTRFLDAIAVGCPVVCSSGGGAASLVAEYEAGVVVDDNNSAVLRSAILTVLSEYQKTFKASSPGQNQTFIKRHSWQQTVKPLLEFCRTPYKNSHAKSLTDLNKLTKELNASVELMPSPQPSAMHFSVLMPTFNRMDIITEVITALENQWNPPSFDLVIINDGSSDGTKKWLDQREFSIPVTIIHQTNSGPANARNRAIEEAIGDYFVFLGDDMVPDRYWLKTHYEAHQKRDFTSEIVVVGQIDWHDAMKMTPFIRFVDETGWQFAFDKIDDPENLPFNYFYGSNVSLHCKQLEHARFNHDFPYPAWEDAELGYRLQLQGCQFVFEHSARTAHLHKTTVSRFANRQFKAGYNGMVFHRLHPEMGSLVWPEDESLKQASGKAMLTFRRVLASLLECLPIAQPGLWHQVLRDHYVMGIKQYMIDHGIRYQSLLELSQKVLFPVRYLAHSPLLQHNTGHLIWQDGTSAWQCLPREHEAGHCVYGPHYKVTENGILYVVFHMQCESNTDQLAVTLDVYDSVADNVLVENLVSCQSMQDQLSIKLSFEANLGQCLEFRVFWHGQCAIRIGSMELCQDSQRLSKA